MGRRWMFGLVKAAIILLIVVPLSGLGVFYLRNWLMPQIFGLHAVTFWQALGLVGLSWILFRAPAFGGRRGWGPRGGMRARWAAMTPEQREQFKQRWQERCGRVAPAQPGAQA